MATSGLNQRQFPRIELECDIAIKDQRKGLLHTRTQNLGLGGLCVILDQEIEKLSKIWMRLSLAQPEAYLECEGRVVWMVKTTDVTTGKTTYDTGIQFLNLNEDQKGLIRSLIDRS